MRSQRPYRQEAALSAKPARAVGTGRNETHAAQRSMKEQTMAITAEIPQLMQFAYEAYLTDKA
jgi:hypothetical protein